MDVYQKALARHEQYRGKIAIQNKAPLKTKEDLSLAYTPGVAEVCRQIAADPATAKRYTLKANSVAVVSDGSAVLGLGNLGALAAIPVMEGKAALFKEFADIDAFPLCLDTQDTEEIIRTIKLIAPVFGGINLEDISAPRCFAIEQRLKKELSIPVLHDDQWGTGVVVLAGLINALKIKKIAWPEIRIVMSGTGAAGTAVAILLLAMGVKNLVMVDSKCIIHHSREDLNDAKKDLARKTNPESLTGDLAAALIGAEVFIGVSCGGILNAELIKSMSAEPIIFALANPTPEIMPDEAKSAGALVVATGRSDFPNQVNNVLAFPGIFRGALDNGVKQITEAMLIQAARNLAACVAVPTADRILPDPFNKEVVKAVARAII